MRIVILIITISFNLFSQTLKDKDYQPTNLFEAIEQLDIILPDSVKQNIINLSEKDFVSNSHRGLGRWIRDEWLVNRFLGFPLGDSKLKKYLISIGLPSNDDMSMVILTSYHRHLNEKDLQIEEQIREVHLFYLKQQNQSQH